MKLLVLAAGYATRLRPLTDNQAKPLLPVKGRPMIDHVLDSFHGAREIDGVFVVTNSRFAPNFTAWAERAPAEHPGWTFRVFDDGTRTNEDRLGAIGDIRFVIEQAQLDDDLLIVAGDNLFTEPMTGFVDEAKRRGVLIGVYDVGSLEEVKKYSTVTLDNDGRIIAFEEKPPNPRGTLVAIALYHYPRTALPLIKQYVAEGNNPDQPGRLVQWLVPRVPCYAYTIPGRWLDIGSRESYDEAQHLL